MLLLPTLAAVTLSISDDSGADLRSVPDENRLTLDVGTSPAANLTFAWKSSTLSLGYSTRLTLFDVTKNRGHGIQHLAGVSYSWSRRRLQLGVSVYGSYGQVVYYNAVRPTTPIGPPAAAGGGNAMPPTTTPPGQAPTARLLPQTAVLTIVEAGGSFSAGYQFSRRWSGYLGVGFGVGGGIRDSAENLPLHYGPSGGVGATYQLSAADTLGTGLSGAIHYVPKTGGKFQTVTLLETWSHTFAPLTTGSVGVGATYARARATSDAKKTHSVNAAGGASFSKGFKLAGGAQLTAGVGANLNTGYDPVLGTLTQSLGGGAGLGWSRKKLTLSAGVQTGHSLPFDDPNAYFTYGAGANASYQLFEALQLRAGTYWTHQVLPASVTLAGANPDMWGASVGVTVFAPPIVF